MRIRGGKKFQQGARVRTLREIASITHPYKAPVGIEGKLWRLEREQDGHEIYSFFVDSGLVLRPEGLPPASVSLSEVMFCTIDDYLEIAT